MIKINKIRVSREKKFLQNKSISDLLYIKIFLEADFEENETFRTIPISRISYVSYAKDLGISRQTVSKQLKSLLVEGFIAEDSDRYIIPFPKEFYYDIEAETLRKLVSFANSNSIKIYAYLLGWDSFCKKLNRTFNYSLDGLCEVIGLAPRQQANRKKIQDILDMLMRLGLVSVSETPDFKVEGTNPPTYHYRLIWASSSLPSNTSGQFDLK